MPGTVRPLYAYTAKDNRGSVRVLEKCGFVRIAEQKEYAEARGEEVEEYKLALAAAAQTPAQ
ncbi:MAG TPA: GNAT family protein [Ktedonobacterales bacterium]|nr:GNAT family protein [Ktedonobacterales bacterium]